jgi:hypothetical protein
MVQDWEDDCSRWAAAGKATSALPMDKYFAAQKGGTQLLPPNASKLLGMPEYSKYAPGTTRTQAEGRPASKKEWLKHFLVGDLGSRHTHQGLKMRKSDGLMR